MICLNCSKETNNPKFCSKSCSASFNNKLYRKRNLEGSCKSCGESISSARTYCSAKCRVSSGVGGATISPFSEVYISRTKGDIRGSRSYQKSSRIRDHARQVVKDREQICQNCGYSKHVHTCHITPILSFSDSATIGEINSHTNLVILCPNCHWEFDNGQLNLPLRLP
jgi:5-methylcytosine-specific restriction endonuclease McrA